ncbi:hypothetical protein, partial [Mesorhizobium sp.]
DGVLGDIGISRDEIMCALRSRATRPAEAFAHARSPRRENDAIPGEIVGHFEIAEQGHHWRNELKPAESGTHWFTHGPQSQSQAVTPYAPQWVNKSGTVLAW